MSTVLVATIAGLLTALLWGIGDWLQAKLSKKAGPSETFFAVTTIGVLMFIPSFLIGELDWPSTAETFRILISGFFIALGYLCFVRAISSGALGIVVPLGNGYPLITLILSLIFLNQVFTTGKIVAMIIISIGAALLAYEKNHKKIPLKELHKDTMLACGAMLLWGVGFFLLNPLFGEVSWQILLTGTTLVEVMLGSILLWLSYKKQSLSVAKKSLLNKRMLVAAVILNLGALTLYIGSDYAENIIIPAVLSAGAPLIVSLLGAIYDHERLGVLKRIGAAAIVAGVIVLNLT